MPVYPILNLIYKLRKVGEGCFQNDTMINFSTMFIGLKIQKHICTVPQAIASYMCVDVFITEFNIEVKERWGRGC